MTETAKFYTVTISETGEIARVGECKSMDAAAFEAKIYTALDLEWTSEGIRGLFVLVGGETVEVVINENDPTFN
jgi:hypothetical protein